MIDKRHQEYIRKARKEAREFADGWAKIFDENEVPRFLAFDKARKEEEAKNPPEPENPCIAWAREGKGGVPLP